MFQSTLLSAPPEVNADFPPKLAPLFKPKRYKVMWGGRNAGRSWGVSRALLILGQQRQLRILCARELQNSIAESVHKVLSDQILNLGLDAFYEIQRDKIIGRNGTTFSFEGIKNNIRKIKSYEGVDICWVEEAVAVSKNSWEVLLPTIRKKGSEVWITFNPELETDFTYVRFVLEADPEESFVVKMTWRDNPWFFQTEGPKQMERSKALDYDEYLNVWEGHCRRMLSGVVYAKELRKAEEESRLCRVPWNRETSVDTFWDLGHRDHTSIWFAQRVGMEFRVLEFFEGSQEDIHFYLRYCQARPYTYGTFWLPHDAKAKRLVSKRSIEEIIRGSGKSVRIVPKLSIADGINATRMIFPSMWFDQKLCAEGLNHLRRYKFAVKDGQFSKDPLHDEHSDAADALRSMGVALRAPKGLTMDLDERLRRANSVWANGPEAGLGWMAR